MQNNLNKMAETINKICKDPKWIIGILITIFIPLISFTFSTNAKIERMQAQQIELKTQIDNKVGEDKFNERTTYIIKSLDALTIDIKEIRKDVKDIK